jgi:hypothetical protein
MSLIRSGELTVRRHLHGLSRADPYTLAIAALSSLYLAAIIGILIGAGAPFAYPLDDTYIHMAMGRTIALSGVWGTDPTQAAAASSSPLWSLLLAALYGLKLDAVFLYVPLFLNVAAGCTLIWLLLKACGTRPPSVALIGAVIYAAALPSLSAIGMEHVLHALLALALGFFVCRSIAEPAVDAPLGAQALIGALTALAVAARYESLFLVAPLTALALIYRRFRLALALLLGAGLPVLGFGLLWIHNGGWLLPNSLMLKSHLTDAAAGGLLGKLMGLIVHMIENLSAGKPAFLAMLVGLMALLGWRLYSEKQWRCLPVLFAGSALTATIIHLALASMGWLYRYEAWLIVLDLTAIALLAQSLWEPRKLFILAAAIAVVFSSRTVPATINTMRAMDDRRLEHLAPAHFVDQLYPGQAVIVNDLGAIAWYAPRTRVLDMYGLGNNEPVRRRLTPQGYDAAAVADWAASTGAPIAILQPCWTEIAHRLPAGWKLVATWRIPRNVVFPDHLVGFFALTSAAEGSLLQQLASYPTPHNVVQTLEPPRTAITEGCKS